MVLIEHTNACFDSDTSHFWRVIRGICLLLDKYQATGVWLEEKRQQRLSIRKVSTQAHAAPRP